MVKGYFGLEEVLVLRPTAAVPSDTSYDPLTAHLFHSSTTESQDIAKRIVASSGILGKLRI